LQTQKVCILQWFCSRGSILRNRVFELQTYPIELTHALGRRKNVSSSVLVVNSAIFNDLAFSY